MRRNIVYICAKSAVSERRDYYEVLGVDRGVDAGELKRAYRKLAMELHPDRNPGDAVSESKFKEASEAYQVLSDPEKRARYDRFGHAGPAAGFGGGFHDVHDIFSAFGDIFGDIFGGGRRRRRSRRDARFGHRGAPDDDAGGSVRRRRQGGQGAAARALRQVRRDRRGGGLVARDLPALRRPRPGDALAGLPDDLDDLPGLPRRGACHPQAVRQLRRQRSGALRKTTLQVSIPAGVEDGSTLRLVGRGEAAPQGGHAGNLYVILRVQPDERFERDGANLHTEVAVSFPQLALGDTRRGPDAGRGGRDRDSAGDAAGRDGGAAGPGHAAHRRAGPGRHRRAPEAGRAVVAVGRRGGAPARLRRVGRTARQPRARRLLQAQEEEIAGAATARRLARAHRRRYHLGHASLVLGARPGCCVAAARLWVGHRDARRRRRGGRHDRDGRRPAARPGPARAAARPGRRRPAAGGTGGGTGDVRVRREVHDLIDGGGLAAMRDTETLTPPNLFHCERETFLTGTPGRLSCDPPMPRLQRSGARRRARRRGGASPIRTCRPRWRWRRRRPSATWRSPTGPTSTSCAPTGAASTPGSTATRRPRPACRSRPGSAPLVELLRALIRQQRMDAACSAHQELTSAISELTASAAARRSSGPRGSACRRRLVVAVARSAPRPSPSRAPPAAPSGRAACRRATST